MNVANSPQILRPPRWGIERPLRQGILRLHGLTEHFVEINRKVEHNSDFVSPTYRDQRWVMPRALRPDKAVALAAAGIDGFKAPVSVRSTLRWPNWYSNCT
jgi:hypothetical protein